MTISCFKNKAFPVYDAIISSLELIVVGVWRKEKRKRDKGRLQIVEREVSVMKVSVKRFQISSD